MLHGMFKEVVPHPATLASRCPFRVDSGQEITQTGWFLAEQPPPGDRLRTASGHHATVGGSLLATSVKEGKVQIQASTIGMLPCGRTLPRMGITITARTLASSRLGGS